MAANNQPQFTTRANASIPVAITLANTSSEGGGTIGTDTFLVFTPGANDSELDFIRLMPTASAASTATQQTVARVYLSTKNSGATSSANTFLIAEYALPSVTADSNTIANTPVDIPIGIRIAGGVNGGSGPFYVLIQNHNTPTASTQWVATGIGRDY